MRVIFHSKTIYNPSTSISKSHIRNQYYTHTYTQKPYINRYALGPAQTNPIHSIHTHIYTYPYFNGVCGRNDVIYDFPFLNFSIIKGKYIYIYILALILMVHLEGMMWYMTFLFLIFPSSMGIHICTSQRSIVNNKNSS